MSHTSDPDRHSTAEGRHPPGQGGEEKSLLEARPGPTDAQLIHELYRRWFGAMERADVNALLALLADGFVFKGPSQPAIADLAAMRQRLVEFHARFDERVDYQVEEVEIAGEWAWARVSERVTVTPKGGGAPTTLSGTHLSILVRQADGSWKVFRDVSSLDDAA